MKRKTATALGVVMHHFAVFSYICTVVRHTYLKREKCLGLFSHVKSGKFSWGEDKLTSLSHSDMAWAVAYFSPRVYQSLHDKMSPTVPRFFCCINVAIGTGDLKTKSL